MISALGIAILAVLGAWLLGGLVLRVGGALLLFGGAVGLAAAGNANGLLVVALGAALWLAGHLHYALRHGAWKSALAGRILEGLVASLHRLAGGPTCLRQAPTCERAWWT